MSTQDYDTTDSARIAALQVGFVSLLELLGQESNEIKLRVRECLRQTAEMPENAPFRNGFFELEHMIEQVSQTPEAPEANSSDA